MKVKIYYQHLIRVKTTELPQLPPFEANQQLSDDEILDILLFGTPKSWQKKMDEFNMDPLQCSLNEVVDFMERIESTEEFHGTTVSRDKSKNKSNGNNKSKPKGTGGGDSYCMYHGKNKSHNTENCTVLLKLAEQKKTPNGSADADKKRKSSVTWKKQSDDATKKSKKDLAAFVKSAIKKGVQTELQSNKRKKDEDESDDDDDLYVLDKQLEEELKDFNYADMENLQIDSDGKEDADSDNETKVSC